jgi:hypothetical protein
VSLTGLPCFDDVLAKYAFTFRIQWSVCNNRIIRHVLQRIYGASFVWIYLIAILGCFNQGCSVGLDVSVSRPYFAIERNVSSRSRLEQKVQRLGLVKLGVTSRLGLVSNRQRNVLVSWLNVSRLNPCKMHYGSSSQIQSIGGTGIDPNIADVDIFAVNRLQNYRTTLAWYYLFVAVSGSKMNRVNGRRCGK